MRTARIKEEGDGCYHVFSRVVDKQFVLNDDEKGRCISFMRKLESFSGVEILTYIFMSNHFHVLLHVPERKPVDDEELIRRLAFIYDEQFVKDHAKHLAALRAANDNKEAEKFKATFTYRMYDLSQFMKTLKQRFTQSYNRRHDRKGTLWEERYKSLLVEHCQGALSAVGAYIDLNAVRAGLVKDPKDYLFCGYGEAVAGVKVARDGITHIACTLSRTDISFDEAVKIYRKHLYLTGEAVPANPASGERAKPGFSEAEVQAVIDAGGALPMSTLLRCKVRYFTNGAVLGCKAYVDDVIRRHSNFFRTDRKSGSSHMKGSADANLFVARRLRMNTIIAGPAVSTG